MYEASTPNGERCPRDKGTSVSTIVLSVDIDATAEELIEILTTTKGQASFWTSDCDFPFWNGSEFSWELGPAARQESGINVLFRHAGFEDGYADQDLGFTAFTWALVLNALKAHAETGEVAPALG